VLSRELWISRVVFWYNTKPFNAQVVSSQVNHSFILMFSLNLKVLGV